MGLSSQGLFSGRAGKGTLFRRPSFSRRRCRLVWEVNANGYGRGKWARAARGDLGENSEHRTRYLIEDLELDVERELIWLRGMGGCGGKPETFPGRPGVVG